MGCPRCGSWSVKADRSLAGRMVCGRCGAPLEGVRAAGRGRSLRPPRLRWGWWVLGLVLLSGALAAWPPRPMQNQREAPTFMQGL
jgi:hypothetical protein